MIDYEQKMERTLARMGGTYLKSDILAEIEACTMQSFVRNNSWVVTKVVLFPRAKQLEVVAMVGDLADGEALHEAVMDYAGESNCSLISTYGRRGWIPNALAHGWKLKAKNYLFHREM